VRDALLRVLGPLTVLAGAFAALAGQVQVGAPRPAAGVEGAAPVPFGPGELLEYDVRLGALGKRGHGHMAVIGVDSVRGRPAYHVSMAYEGGLLFAKVKDHYQSWLDVRSLVSLRFIQDIDQLNYERYKHYEIFPEEMRYERRDKIDAGPIPTPEPLDDVSFFYFVRSIPLEVGKEYSYEKYFRESGNPVVLRVLRRDTVQVPAGTFATIVVQPIIRTSGLFGQGGEAQLHFSDDERRLLVLMTSKVPLVGSLSLHLRTIREGQRLTDPGGGGSRAP
jgi:hypothetical protein